MENKELIAFKGMVDGVRINLGDEGGIFELLDELELKIKNSKGFFGDGDCKISFGGRRLSSSDKERLESLMKELLPLCRVDFESEKSKSIPQTDWMLAYKERGKGQENTQESELPKKTTEEFISTFRSNRARLYQGTLKTGVTLRSDGHLVLLGTVNEGASLIAVGNIIVIGGLYGTAHAGCNGHNGSYIMAMDMHPEGLAIAQTGEKYTYSDNDTETEPIEIEKKGFFEKFRKKADVESIPDEENHKEEAVSAVALLKNNKIQVDNFTFEDFTKLKNMV